MDPISITILIIEVIGFVGAGVVIYRMKQQVEALGGTVKTQAEALRTLGDLNKTALEMAKAFDPKKYVEVVKAYEELMERKATATVDEARREFEQREGCTVEALKVVAVYYKLALLAGYSLMAYVPKERREEAINDAPVPHDFKGAYRELAASAPDLSMSPLMRLASDALGIGITERAHVQKREP